VRRRKSFDQVQEFMDYRLERVPWDSPPPREALRVAELLGLDPAILQNAVPGVK
jgi:hypothetical protein